jgi:hypothetical protein
MKISLINRKYLVGSSASGKGMIQMWMTIIISVLITTKFSCARLITK